MLFWGAWEKNLNGEGKEMAECYKELTEAVAEKLQAAIDETPSGGVLCLKKGTYPGNLRISKSITIKGVDGARETVLSSKDRGSVVTITGDDYEVRLSGLTFRDGNAPESGGGINLQGFSLVAVADSIFENNRARQYGGGAVYAGAGEVVIERCVLSGNSAGTMMPGKEGSDLAVGRNGGAIFADGIAKVTLKDSLIVKNSALNGSAVLAKEGSSLEIRRCTIADNSGETALKISSSTTRSPSVKISESIVSGKISAPNYPKSQQIEVENSVFETAIEGAAIKGSFKIANPEFTGSGDKPYMPKKSSPCVKVGKGGGVDLYGTKRPEKESTIGAIELK